jgi:Secretion system C-terminal sorting domain
MRFLLSLLTIVFFIQSVSAQLRTHPLPSNPIVQKAAAQLKAARLAPYADKMQEEGYSDRSHDCDNIDEAFTSGETLYVDAGDSLKICYNTNIYEVFADISTNLTYGSATITSSASSAISCIVYYADASVSLGMTDTLRVKFCEDIAQTDCFSFFFPLVVKRPDTHTAMPLMTLQQEQTIEITVEDFQLEGDIHRSEVRACGNTLLGNVYNVNFGDSSFVYVASRFAEVDSVCFEICDQFCICDSYTYYFNTVGASAPFPFMDDFSYNGPYPDKTKWLNDEVFVNYTIGYLPPSVGVATFDGLDESGTPRNIGKARSDFLTSNYFTFNASDTDIWLSFWLQNKGYGYPSDPGDSLVVEFKNKNGNWIPQESYNGGNFLNSELPDFEFYKLKIPANNPNTQDTFLFDGFQFRFINIGNTNSIQDIWNLDYVRLDEGEPNGTISDVAFSTLPSGILKRYSSMPFWQFEGNAATELSDSLAYVIRNHFSTTIGINDSEVSHIANPGNTDLGGQFAFVNLPTNIASGDFVNVTREFLPAQFNEVKAGLDALTGADYLTVDRIYNIDINETQASILDVLRNDEVRKTTVFDNYFAYDDGTAELAVSVDGTTQIAAVGFRANYPDQLRGVSFHFPHYEQASVNDLFNLKIWVGSLESEPVYERDLLKPFFVDQVFNDSLQGFTTYRLQNDLNQDVVIDLPAGDFFIGWQNGSVLNPVRIGMDNNPSGALGNQYVSNNGLQWFQTADKGAYMVRALVGSEIPGSTKSKDVLKKEKSITVYPNPSNGQLYFAIPSGNLNDYDLTLMTASGQRLLQQALNASLDISDVGPGIYFLQMIHRETKDMQVERVVVIE